MCRFFCSRLGSPVEKTAHGVCLLHETTKPGRCVLRDRCVGAPYGECVRWKMLAAQGDEFKLSFWATRCRWGEKTARKANPRLLSCYSCGLLLGR